jgi:hypothetical protein
MGSNACQPVDNTHEETYQTQPGIFKPDINNKAIIDELL